VQTARWIASPLTLLDDCQRRYGDLFTLRLIGIGEVVFVSAPSAIKTIFLGDPEVLHAGAGNALLRPVLGSSSVLLLDGSAHLRQRRLLLPPFHGERMQAYAEVMQKVTRTQMARWPVGHPFALAPETRAITLEVILRTVFGIEEAAQLGHLSQLLARLLDLLSQPVTLVPALLGWDLFRHLPRAPASRIKREVDRLLYTEIARRRSAPRGTDVLSMLLDARDEDGKALSDQELRDELMTLLTAGHETTATALAWTFERILHERAVRVRVEEELSAQPDGGDYLDAVIKESLRVRPIIPIVARQLKRDLVLDRFTLPEGVRVAPCIYLTHKRADVYPEPERFRPERFLGKKPDPYAWLPFGGGIRRCLGMAFALFEMKLVLSTVLSHAELRLPAGAPARMVRRGITLSPSGGTRVILVKRRDPALCPAQAAPPAA